MNQQDRGEISTAYGKLGHLTVTLTSEIVEDKLLDTKVEIEGGVMCWIHGADRELFASELSDALNAIVDKYRI